MYCRTFLQEVFIIASLHRLHAQCSIPLSTFESFDPHAPTPQWPTPRSSSRTIDIDLRRLPSIRHTTIRRTSDLASVVTSHVTRQCRQLRRIYDLRFGSRRRRLVARPSVISVTRVSCVCPVRPVLWFSFPLADLAHRPPSTASTCSFAIVRVRESRARISRDQLVNFDD
ncbi:uncharacterized protein LOC112457552 [Temnothorax curvispinosus]|uniref:Uncharacterized protein LOC112457552 n=1 Tax=Temnothorax curvispinosus TaxID=300111 RepID=A0A6J1Q470_9HYME|nr:uncharacterized protein LOC112457552 [Temnothorax curvispinosus]